MNVSLDFWKFPKYATNDLFNYEIIMNLLIIHYEMTLTKIIKIQKQPPRVILCFPINFTKFIGKHLCQNLFLIKLQTSGLQLY